MVGIRFFLIFIIVFYTYVPFVYGLRYFSAHDNDRSSVFSDEEDVAGEFTDELKRVKERKEAISKEAIKIRKEREGRLRPFVSAVKEPYPDIFPQGDYDKSARYMSVFSGKETANEQEEISSEKSAKKPGPLFNLTFLLILGASFFAASVFIRPK